MDLQAQRGMLSGGLRIELWDLEMVSRFVASDLRGVKNRIVYSMVYN